MPKRWLAIEHHPQEADAGCLAACVQMALAHLNIPTSQQVLNRLFGLTPAGVPVSRLVRLERFVFVRTGSLPYWSLDTQHALLVSGYDGNDLLINDPAFLIAPQRVSAAVLQLAWDEFDGRYAILRRASDLEQ